MHEFLVEFFAQMTGIEINITQNNLNLDGNATKEALRRLLDDVSNTPRANEVIEIAENS